MKMTTFDQHAHDLAPAMGMMRDNETLALCARLQAAAIKCDDYHVFVDYAAHTNALTVCVRDTHMDYSAPVDTWPEPLIYETTYLNAEWCDAVEKLTEIIGQIQRLDIDVQ